MRLLKGITFLFLLTTMVVLTGCNSKPNLIELPHYNQLTEGQAYNNNLFYRNDLQTLVADPSVVYVTDGEEAGYFYMYGTTSELGASGVYSWRSTDLQNWEVMGPAFIPNRDAWAIRDIWAPEVIYMNNQYYMYYTGTNEVTRHKGISVAVSNNPYGPFREYNGVDGNGNSVDHRTQLFSFPWPAIDASPFVASNGDLYLYIAKDQVDGQSTIWGVKMMDPFTAEMNTLTQLTDVAKDSVGGTTNRTWERATSGLNGWNEGPFMVEQDGKYYLTYSANPFWTREYAVGYAVGDSPLGNFVKPENNRLLGVDPLWDHVSGTGHHCFVKAGNELFAVYHAHTDRLFGNSARAVAFDKVNFREDGSMFINGPTYSLQPLPEVVTGYKNIASLATISASNAKGNSNANLLTDGEVVFHANFKTNEFQANGTTTITLTFSSEVTARAILIYNSYDYETGFKKIDSIIFNGKYVINNLGYDSDYVSLYDPEFPTARPGGAAIAEFDELKVTKIEITIASDTPISISDIVVLGKSN